MSRWPEGALTRDEVEPLLHDGASWEVNYCWGGHRRSESGAGRRIERGKSRRTFFYAQVRDGDGVLVLSEGDGEAATRFLVD